MAAKGVGGVAGRGSSARKATHSDICMCVAAVVAVLISGVDPESMYRVAAIVVPLVMKVCGVSWGSLQLKRSSLKALIGTAGISCQVLVVRGVRSRRIEN